MMLIGIAGVLLCACFTTIPDKVLIAAQSVAKVHKCSGVGSAAYIGNSLWVTNRHMCCSCGKAKLTCKSGEQVVATVLAKSSTVDIALLRSEPVDLKPIPLATEPAGSGKTYYPTGYDFGRNHSIWPAQFKQRWNSGTVVFVGSTVRRGSVSGNSGGPVLTADGTLIGPLWGNTSSSGTKTGSGTTTAVGWHETQRFLQRYCPDGTCPPRQYRPGVKVPLLPQRREGREPEVQVVPPPSVQTAPPQRKGLLLDQQPDIEDIIRRVIAETRVQGERGPAGPKGERGATGPAGPPVDFEALYQAILARLKVDLRVRVVSE